MTAEAIFRLVNDPVLPFYPLDVALDVQNKLKGEAMDTDGGYSENNIKGQVLETRSHIHSQKMDLTKIDYSRRQYPADACIQLAVL